MGRWRAARVGFDIWKWSSPSYASSPVSKAFGSYSLFEEGSQHSGKNVSLDLGWRRFSKAGMATKSGDGDKQKWRQWVEGKLADSSNTPGPGSGAAREGSSASTAPPKASSAVDDFERYVLGKTGEEEEGEDADFHDLRESVSAGQQPSTDQQPEEDDFLEELTKIERGGLGGDSWGRKKDRHDLMFQRGYDDDKVPFDDEVDPENDESLLDQEDAVFWNEELQKFVTPKGLLNLPGMGREDISKPYQLRPDRVYFPGQTIEPEDFDITRLPSSDPLEGPPRQKKKYRKTEVLAAADFRNVKFLSLFLSETSKILPRRSTSVALKAQRKIAREIKTARALGLLPFTSMGDPPFRYLKNKPAKDVDPEDEYDDNEDEEGGGPRFRRRMF